MSPTLHMTLKWEPIPGHAPGRSPLDCYCQGAHGRWLIRRVAGRESTYVVRLDGEERTRCERLEEAKAYAERVEQGAGPAPKARQGRSRGA